MSSDISNDSYYSEIDWNALARPSMLPSQPTSQPISQALKSQLVPIGRYKGQPIEVLAQDRSYCNWLSSQPWFRDNHPNIYSIIINNFTEPNETPAHNQMQVKFLDSEWRSKVAILVNPNITKTLNRVFIIKELADSFHTCTKDSEFRLVWDLDETVCVQHKNTRGEWYESWMIKLVNAMDTLSVGKPTFEHSGIDVLYSYHVARFSKYIEDWLCCGTLNIEIKPTVGDDFPAILRQIKRLAIEEYNEYLDKGRTQKASRSREGRWVLLIRDYTGSVPIETFKEFMRMEKITVILESEIDSVVVPDYSWIEQVQDELYITVDDQLQAFGISRDQVLPSSAGCL